MTSLEYQFIEANQQNDRLLPKINKVAAGAQNKKKKPRDV